jgi:helicase SWR1
MEDVTLVKADPNPPPPHDAPIALDGSAAANNTAASHSNGALAIKPDEGLGVENGEEGGAIQRPAKRRKLEDLASSRSTPRAISPPWKQFSANGPTTIFDNGIRKSSRVNKDTPPPPEPAKRSTRKAHKGSGAKTNGTPKTGVKQNGSRVISGPAGLPKTKAGSAHTKKAPVSSLKSPAARQSARQRNISTAATPTSPAFQNGTSDTPRARPGRPRRATQTSTDELDADMFNTPSHYVDDFQAYGDFHSPPPDPDNSAPTPRLRLRLRKPDPPNRHPHHTAPPPKYPSFVDWLELDDPLEGEEAQRITQDKAEEEAQRRLRIVDAAERGVLSETKCSIFTPQAAEEPPPQYSHWDHVVAHALHFNKLLKEESNYHRRMAKTLAREAVDYWKEKYKRKTQDEIDQEETDRVLIRYKQLVKDIKDSWANVKVGIDKERVAKWEEEQLQLGHKAMDDMFNQAQEILGRNVVDSASSLVSDDRETEDDQREFESGVSDAIGGEDDAENMSSSSDSDNGHENDEDANLTAEELQAKYGQLPDLPQESSDEEDDEEEEEEEEEDEEGLENASNERTPEPTPDRDLQMEDANDLSTDIFTDANGFHSDEEDAEREKPDYIDPATVELEVVDNALLDSDDEGTGGSQSGSEEWGSDDESEAENQSESGSEDGDDIGVMGFLNPTEIKKMKEAAKASIIDIDTDATLPQTNDQNGDHDRSEAGADIVETNGDTEATPELKEDHANGVANGDAAEPAPSIEITETKEMDEVESEQVASRSRSRRGSSPPRTEIPSLLRGTLREYQHGGLDWLANLYDSDTNGILADEMGLGKTIQTISLLAYIAVYREKWGPHLVVVPTSVMLNWEMEFKKWCPGFKILTYYGDINERKRKRMGWRTTGPDMYNVIITSYQLILQDAAAFKMRAWQYLVLDEAHNIKNFKSQRWQTMLNLRTERRLLLTGTPLQNNIDELWSLLYFLMPAGFAGEGRIAGLEEFTMALKNPTSQILEQGRQQLDAEAQKIVRKLHEVLRPYLLRRLKADVEKQMPGKYEHVVYCKLSRRQRQLYDGFMGRAATKEILASGNYMSIINCLMSLRKVCNHPDLFETRAIVTSLAMPKSVAAAYEIKDFFVRRRMHAGIEEEKVNLEALNLVFARREQTSMLHARRSQQIRATRPLRDLIERQTRRLSNTPQSGVTSVQSVLSAIADREHVAVRDHLQTCLNLTRSRTQFLPIYGKGLIQRLTMDYQDYTFGAREEGVPIPSDTPAPALTFPMANQVPTQPVVVKYTQGKKGLLGFRAPRNPLNASEWYRQQIEFFHVMVPTLEQRAEALEPIITRFSCVTPAVAASELAPLTLSPAGVEMVRSSEMAKTRDPFHESRIRLSIAFPDKRLLQYDCGKLQRLATLLRDLQAGGHRALIFTQMTKVLDILEQFLNIHGYRYLRLDGATKVEQRQILTDRFNNDPRIPVFILSSRSGGLGINLTGADTVIFYDLDWNPAMDKQCQDRSHRIGQTRDVHIYKFVSEYTIEANILRKSNQKRLLDDVIIQKGDFTTDTFNRVTWRDAIEDENAAVGDEAGAAMDRVLGERAGLLGDAQVMSRVEDVEDRTAASVAQKEIVDEIQEDGLDFTESMAATRAASEARHEEDRVEGKRKEAEEWEKVRRHVDEYMLDLGREEWGQEPYRPPTERQKRGRKGQDVHRTRVKKKY